MRRRRLTTGTRTKLNEKENGNDYKTKRKNKYRIIERNVTHITLLFT